MNDEIVFNENYWECECEHDYIKPNTQKRCPECNAEREYQPPSRQNEVDRWLRKRIIIAQANQMDSLSRAISNPYCTRGYLEQAREESFIVQDLLKELER